MQPFTRILVPTDFSSHAAEAVRYAADLSRRYDASVMLLHVYQPVAFPLPEGYILYTPSQLAGMLAEFERQLETAQTESRAAGAVRVETKLVQGVASSEIVRLVKEGAYDLIVMGTHGRTGVEHALFGSVAEKVVRKAACAVLTVRSAENDSGRR